MHFLEIDSETLLYTIYSLVSSDYREFHYHLRHFVINRSLIDDVAIDEQTSDIQAFNQNLREELRE